jgi:outer membrane receptor protein involved in Fe transport
MRTQLLIASSIFAFVTVPASAQGSAGASPQADPVGAPGVGGQPATAAPTARSDDQAVPPPSAARQPAETSTGSASGPGAAEAGDLVIVTGSRIPRPTYERDQPTITISSQQLEARAFTDVGQLLSQAPGFGIADSSLVGNQGNGFGVGQTFVNLYSLGSQRTLTLVNGRRFVGANPATPFSSAGAGTQVDLNVIPTNLLQRVEVVGIGGAPIYGADAIAGTVNFVTRDRFQGVQLDALTGISGQGDLPEYRIRGIVGTNFAGGRGNVMVAGEYVDSRGLLGNQRQRIRQQFGFVSPTDPNSPFSQVLVRDVRTFLGVPGGNPYFLDRGTLGPTRSITDASGNLVRFAPDGTLVPFNTGTSTNSPTTFLGGDSLNFADITNLAVDSQRVNVVALASYDLTDHLRLFAEGWYSNNKNKNLAGQPVYNTAFFRAAPAGTFDVNGNFIFRLNNPFLTTQARDLIRQNLVRQRLYTGNDATSIFYLGRANTDLVSGVARNSQDLYRIVGGLKGDFRLLGSDWKFEAYGNYGRTRTESIQPSLVEPNLRRALNVTRNASGNIVCAPFNPDPNDPTQPPLNRTDPNTPPFNQQYNGTISQTCAPLNLFGNGAPTQAARDYVTTNARTIAITEQRDFVASATGNLAKLPGGNLGVSLAYENRWEFSRFSPDPYYTTPLGRSIPINALAGSYLTNEVSAEVLAPIIGPDQRIPLVYSLSVNAAARYVDNSVAGSDVTWTAGGRWSPIRDIAIRGNYTRSIRAPAVTELFAQNQPAFDGGFDPCDQANLTSGPNPAVRQRNCAAAGLPTDFNSLINQVTVPINVIGNRGLQNETADSWTAGAVITPRFIPRLSLSADYISIDLRNTVVASSARDVLSGCYDSANYPNNFYCGLITRDRTPGPDTFGQVLTLNEPYINQGGNVFRALQVAFDYNLNLPRDFGKLTFGANWQHLIKQYRVISADAGVTQQRGQIGSSVDQFNIRANYEKDVFNWYNEVRYISPAVFDATEPPGTRDVQGVGAYVVWNTSFGFTIDKRYKLQFNVDNVLDRGLPYPASGSGSQNVYYEGIFGRRFRVTAGVTF